MQRTIRSALTSLALVITSSQSALAAPPKIVVHPATVEHPATVKLLAADGKIGRDNAFYDNYRPQLVFSGEKSGITCAIQFTKPQEKLEPGETADVKLSCLEQFKVVEGQPSFTGLEGGRLVIQGSLR